MRLMKYTAIAVGTTLWGFGFLEQMHSLQNVTTYLVLSAALVAIAKLA